jgi:tetrahydromethanopterin S-methyltransferase subunit G
LWGFSRTPNIFGSPDDNLFALIISYLDLSMEKINTVNFAVRQVMKDQRCGRDIALLFL